MFRYRGRSCWSQRSQQGKHAESTCKNRDFTVSDKQIWVTRRWRSGSQKPHDKVSFAQKPTFWRCFLFVVFLLVVFFFLKKQSCFHPAARPRCVFEVLRTLSFQKPACVQSYSKFCKSQRNCQFFQKPYRWTDCHLCFGQWLDHYEHSKCFWWCCKSILL